MDRLRLKGVASSRFPPALARATRSIRYNFVNPLNKYSFLLVFSNVMRLPRPSNEAIRKRHLGSRAKPNQAEPAAANSFSISRSTFREAVGTRSSARLEQASAYFHRDDEPCPRGIFAMRNTQPDRKRRVILAEATDASHAAILIAIPINCRSCNTRALSLMWDGDKSAPGGRGRARDIQSQHLRDQFANHESRC